MLSRFNTERIIASVVASTVLTTFAVVRGATPGADDTESGSTYVSAVAEDGASGTGTNEKGGAGGNAQATATGSSTDTVEAEAYAGSGGLGGGPNGQTGDGGNANATASGAPIAIANAYAGHATAYIAYTNNYGNAGLMSGAASAYSSSGSASAALNLYGGFGESGTSLNMSLLEDVGASTIGGATATAMSANQLASSTVTANGGGGYSGSGNITLNTAVTAYADAATGSANLTQNATGGVSDFGSGGQANAIWSGSYNIANLTINDNATGGAGSGPYTSVSTAGGNAMVRVGASNTHDVTAILTAIGGGGGGNHNNTIDGGDGGAAYVNSGSATSGVDSQYGNATIHVTLTGGAGGTSRDSGAGATSRGGSGGAAGSGPTSIILPPIRDCNCADSGLFRTGDTIWSSSTPITATSEGSNTTATAIGDFVGGAGGSGIVAGGNGATVVVEDMVTAGSLTAAARVTSLL